MPTAGLLPMVTRPETEAVCGWTAFAVEPSCKCPLKQTSTSGTNTRISWKCLHEFKKAVCRNQAATQSKRFAEARLLFERLSPSVDESFPSVLQNGSVPM